MNKKLSILGVILVLSISATTSILFHACKKDKDCPAGYEGSDCDVKSITKFLGKWNAFEDCTTNPSSHFTVTIDPNPSSPTQIKIDGFAAAIPVVAEVDGNTFTVDGTFEKYYFQGTGTITSDGKTISVSYKEDDQFYNFSCTGTWTKQ